MFDEKQYRKDYYLKNKELILARTKARSQNKKQEIRESHTKLYRTKNGRIIRFLAGAKKRAKAKNLEFDLDLEFLRSIAPDMCPVFGYELVWDDWGDKEQQANDFSPSLDRIDPTKGYLKTNVQWLSWKANRLKNNFTCEDFKIMLIWMETQAKKEKNDETELPDNQLSKHTDGVEAST
jgi:hypothetical protein